ncbi:hypothetical protein J437_LFUL009062 [Ladona fulva]|uniref:PHD-type domain-containing protein n=1 Tax=Ladona fulva TaxID=123851 RepID=A0A8K0KBB8_LADFU|nr:hypothetical protein J437_LFUL009062 [Ladona fulva]
MEAAGSFLQYVVREGETQFSQIVPKDEIWVHHSTPESKRQKMLKKHLGGRRFPNDEKLKNEVDCWARNLVVEWCDTGLMKFLPRYKKCLEKYGDYMENDQWIKMNLKSEEEEKTECGECGEHRKNMKLVDCEGSCGGSFYIKCIRISAEVLKMINLVKGVKWFCQNCNVEKRVKKELLESVKDMICEIVADEMKDVK